MIETVPKKQQALQRALSERKEHFKMYKVNKFWVYAGVSVVLFSFGSLTNNVQAEASSTSKTETSVVSQLSVSQTGQATSTASNTEETAVTSGDETKSGTPATSNANPLTAGGRLSENTRGQ